MPIPIPQNETRSFERVQHHYVIEKELAARLRMASKEDRRKLYSTVYDELWQQVPDHPRLALKRDTGLRRVEVFRHLRMLGKYLDVGATFLEIGPGDCALAIEASRWVRQVIAVDVARKIFANILLLKNLELVISDGCSIPVPRDTVNVAYSGELMEHLHPDDAAEQLRNIYSALAPGGVYLCVTPNRWSGPHDISRYFDEIATGFHLREYTVSELAQMFHEAGFSRLRILAGEGSLSVALPVGFVQTLERLLDLLPPKLGRTLARRLPLRAILGAKLLARK